MANYSPQQLAEIDRLQIQAEEVACCRLLIAIEPAIRPTNDLLNLLDWTTLEEFYADCPIIEHFEDGRQVVVLPDGSHRDLLSQ